MIANDVRPTRKQYGIGQLNFFPTVNVYRASEVQNCSSCLLCHSISRERYRTSSIFSLQLMSHLGSNIEGKKCWVLSPSGRRVRSQLVVCQRTGYFYQGILFLLTLSPMSSLILRDSDGTSGTSALEENATSGVCGSLVCTAAPVTWDVLLLPTSPCSPYTPCQPHTWKS